MTSPVGPKEIFEMEIDAVAHGGDGVGRVQGKVCFVAGAIPGDIVQATVYRSGPRAMWADLHTLLSPSPVRERHLPCMEQACTSACAWRAFAYPAQAAWKRRIVADCLERIGGIHTEIGWLERADQRLGYRTRAVFHGDGNTIGYYVPRTHKVVPMAACLLNHPRLNEALQALRMPGIRGDIHVTVNPEGTETLVFLREDMPVVRKCFPRTNTPLDGSRFHFLFDGVPIVNGGFSQSSLLLNRMLRAHTDACIGNPENLLDLYCGNGNLSLHHAGSGEVCGVDHDEVVVNAVGVLAPGIYVRGDERYMLRALAERDWKVIVLDPPRTGARALVEALATARAHKLVYVSCDPATLARDLRGILAGGWSITQATAVDMFPYTPHVETVCVMERT